MSGLGLSLSLSLQMDLYLVDVLPILRASPENEIHEPLQDGLRRGADPEELKAIALDQSIIDLCLLAHKFTTEVLGQAVVSDLLRGSLYQGLIDPPGDHWLGIESE